MPERGNFHVHSNFFEYFMNPDVTEDQQLLQDTMKY